MFNLRAPVALSARSTVMFVALLLTGIVGAACSSAGADGNTLTNGGFEDGRDGWAALTSTAWEPRFDVSSDVAYSGSRSAYLRMRTDATTPDTRIWGVTQEVTADEFPARLRGYYRVDAWERGAPSQYMQIVVIALGADNVPDPEFPNHQIRYILNGIGTPPFDIRNAKYVFIDRGEPRQGEWVAFDLPVADDFRELWGDVPKGFDAIRLLFEVRFDEKPQEGRPSADVYFDDFYFGDGGAETAG
jgi:hypothetical protein